jgi:hypothetical protein
MENGERKNKTHWRKVFDSDYLGSCDLEDGKDLRAVIKSVTVRKVKNTDGKEQERNVATFTDAKLKPMILNATNCKVVKKFAKSPYINDWNNIAVQIYVKDDIRAFGDITEGLRIRETQPSLSKPKLIRDMPAWSKVIEYVKSGKPLSDIELKYDISEVKDEILREAV